MPKTLPRRRVRPLRFRPHLEAMEARTLMTINLQMIAPPHVVEGAVSDSLDLASVTFSVGMPTEYAATIDWGDGTTSPGTIAGGKVSAAHTYHDEGAVTVQVTVTGRGTSASGSSSLTVDDAAKTVTALALSPVVGVSFSKPVGTFVDANPDTQLSQFSASITWGDGTTSAGTVAVDPVVARQYVVSGANTYRTDALFATTVQVSEVDGIAKSASGTATVLRGAVEGSPFTGIAVRFIPGPWRALQPQPTRRVSPGATARRRPARSRPTRTWRINSW